MSSVPPRQPLAWAPGPPPTQFLDTQGLSPLLRKAPGQGVWRFHDSVFFKIRSLREKKKKHIWRGERKGQKGDPGSEPPTRAAKSWLCGSWTAQILKLLSKLLVTGGVGASPGAAEDGVQGSGSASPRRCQGCCRQDHGAGAWRNLGSERRLGVGRIVP